MGSGLSQEEPVEEEIVSEAIAALYVDGFLPHSKFDEFEEFEEFVVVVSSINLPRQSLPSGVTASAIFATG